MFGGKIGSLLGMEIAKIQYLFKIQDIYQKYLNSRFYIGFFSKVIFSVPELPPLTINYGNNCF